ncbi:unnamed protein product [Calypogeia fissa]
MTHEAREREGKNPKRGNAGSPRATSTFRNFLLRTGSRKTKSECQVAWQVEGTYGSRRQRASCPETVGLGRWGHGLIERTPWWDTDFVVDEYEGQKSRSPKPTPASNATSVKIGSFPQNGGSREAVSSCQNWQF